MHEYHKINSIFKRDMDKNSPNYGNFIMGEYSCPEFELLKDIKWVWTEKIDGTNIRVCWYRCPILPQQLEFKGKTDKAQMPEHLGIKLAQMFTKEKMEEVFPSGEELPDVTLYGEGYGFKIQKGGKYMKDPKEVSFILFDINIGGVWLKRENVEEIATKLGIDVVPVIGEGTIDEAIELVKLGYKSHVGKLVDNDFIAEGLVLRPKFELKNRRGGRIITKIKYKEGGGIK